MKLTIEPTDQFVEIGADVLPTVLMCRQWIGTDEHGTEVIVLVMALSPQTHDPEKLRAFESELLSIPDDDTDT